MPSPPCVWQSTGTWAEHFQSSLSSRASRVRNTLCGLDIWYLRCVLSWSSPAWWFPTTRNLTRFRAHWIRLGFWRLPLQRCPHLLNRRTNWWKHHTFWILLVWLVQSSNFFLKDVQQWMFIYNRLLFHPSGKHIRECKLIRPVQQSMTVILYNYSLIHKH